MEHREKRTHGGLDPIASDGAARSAPPSLHDPPVGMHRRPPAVRSLPGSAKHSEQSASSLRVSEGDGSEIRAPEATHDDSHGIALGVLPRTAADDTSFTTSPHPTNSLTTSQRAADRGQAYILKVCRALMTFGAPTHRLEMYMHSTAGALGLSLQSFHMPGCMILSFNQVPSGSTQVHIVRCSSSLNLAKLYQVHGIYKAVIHRSLCVEEATSQLAELMEKNGKFPMWFRILNYGLASAFIGPVSYDARPIDLPIIFILGAAVGFLELVLSPKSELYGYIFEISSAILVSLLGRAFGSIASGGDPIFCFSAIAQASIVLILPGFTLTTAALEIQTGNMVSGSVRIVYAIVYTLFLAFGFIIGITVYGAMDSEATSATQCQNIWPFWWQIAFVLPFTVCYIVVYQGDWKKMPGMLFVTLSGWVVNHFSSQRLASIPSLGQALGALAAGILANLMSRFGHGFAVAILYPAIFIQVPGSLAAAGSLIGGIASSDRLIRGNDPTEQAGTGQTHPGTAVLNAGYAAIEIAIGITVGLSVSAFFVYPFRKTKGKSGIFSF